MLEGGNLLVNTCFRSSFLLAISAAFSSLLIPTVLGSVGVVGSFGLGLLLAISREG